MSEESFWKGRCGAEKAKGGRCAQRGVACHGGRCHLHSELAQQARAAHQAARRKAAEEAPRCKSLNQSGWRCPHAAASGYEHCWVHLRTELRNAELVRAPRPSMSEQRVVVATARQREDKRLEAENDDLRRQLTELSIELEKTKAALELARAWRKPVERVNGEARS